MKSVFVGLTGLAAVAGIAVESADEDVNRPVAKVLKLLTEMKVTLEKEQEQDVEMFEKMDCWCKTNREEKTAAVEAAEKKIADLKAAIEEYTARAAELETQIKNLKADIAKNQESLATATELRAKENEEFVAEEKEMVETIDSLAKAVTALGGVHSSLAQKKVALVQLQDTVQPLAQSSKYADIMRKDLWAVLGSFNAQQPQVEMSATQVFSEMFSGKPSKAFLQSAQPAENQEMGDGQGSAEYIDKDNAGEAGGGRGGLISGKKAEAYEDAMTAKEEAAYKAKHLQGGGAKGVKSYNSQSGAIYGILQQMHEDFETKLSNARADEAAALKAFQAMKAALLKELAAQEEAKKSKKSDLADTNTKNAQAKTDKKATEDALDADTKFLLDMEATCKTSQEDHDARVKERSDEILAVGEAMGILTSDESRDLMTRTLSFVQVKSKSTESTQHRIRSRAARVILRAAKKSGNYQLAALAVSAQLDAFTKVKKAMDDMLAELKKQQKMEYEKKEFCNKEIDVNEDETTAKTNFKEDTESNLKDLEVQIDTMTKEINVLEVEIVNTQQSIKKAGEDRAAENKEFQTTVNDQRMTVTILTKALDRLKAFYEKKAALLIQVGSAQPGKANAPPPKQASYGKSDGAPGAMGLLEMIIMDAKAMEKEALKDEQDAQANYAQFVTNANKSVATSQSQIESNTVAKAKAEATHAEQSASLSDTVKILATLASENQNLHTQCDFTLKNYEITQTARGEEMESIEQAKAVLSGADFSL